MKIIKNIMMLAALLSAAAVMFSCTAELGGEHDSIKAHISRTVTFNACEVQTKTTFGQGEDGTYPTLWTTNDASVKLALNYTPAAEVKVVPSDDFRKASFSAEIDASGENAPYTFYAVSPASAARALSPSRQAWSISIPSVQTPLEGSVDEAAMILAAASQPSDAIPQSVDLHFNHLTAYARMSFTNLELGGATVESVEITATTPLAGDWYWDCTGEHALTDNGASSTITLNTSRTSDIWFACAPVDMSGEIAVITVYTDQGAMVKEIEFAQDRKFQPGRIAVFTVDMSGIEPVAPAPDAFVLVTDASQLQDGDEILILDDSEQYAIGTNQKTNNRAAASVSVSDHTITEVPDDVQIISLEAGSSADTWHFNVGTGYLANANGGKNKLVTADSKTANATWTISIKPSGAATVVAGAGERNSLRFNDGDANNLLFACYSSGQQGIVIYRKGVASSAGPVAEDPLTQQSEYGVYLKSGNRVYQRGVDQYSRRYSDSGVQTFAILYSYPALAKEQVEITGYRKALVKGDDVKITVNWRLGANTVQSEKTYTLKVVKEEGPKVWLGDGSGNGFIIKK